MKKLLPALCLGIALLAGCATYVEPAPVYYPGGVYIYGSPYYGPYWNGYYWHPDGHYYYRPGYGRHR